MESTQDAQRDYRLAVNAYDRFSSLLISLLMMVGLAVAILAFVWFVTHFEFKSTVATQFKPVEFASRPMEAAKGFARDLEPPGFENAPELFEPQLQDTLTTLSNLSTRTALLSDREIDAVTEAGRGTGQGDSRRAGRGGEGIDAPEPQREITFEPNSIEQYAAWYDYYKLELGVLDQEANLIHYASQLSLTVPKVRSAPPSEEVRLYTVNPAGSPLNTLDRRLAKKGGIDSKGTYLVTFWPSDSAQLLLEPERERATKQGRELSQVQRTVFRVTAEDDAFQIAIEEQLYYY